MQKIVDRMGAEMQAGGFAEHMASDDLLSLVLRAHLWVERELRAIIEAPLPHPERLKRPWSFQHRLELVAALGIIDDEDLPAYRYLDDLRNRLAHRFNYRLSEQDQAALIARMRPETRSSVEATQGSLPFPESLRQALKMLVAMLQLQRHGLVRFATQGPDE